MSHLGESNEISETTHLKNFVVSNANHQFSRSLFHLHVEFFPHLQRISCLTMNIKYNFSGIHSFRSKMRLKMYLSRVPYNLWPHQNNDATSN